MMYIQFRAQHAHAEVIYCEWQKDTDAKTYSPNSVQMGITCSRQDDEEHRDHERSTKLRDDEHDHGMHGAINNAHDERQVCNHNEHWKPREDECQDATRYDD